MRGRCFGEENGQIIITPSDPILAGPYNHELTFSGQAGYAHCIDELNKVCSIYGQGKYADTSKFSLTQTVNTTTSTTPNASGARSINADDLERIGYTVTRVGTSGTNTRLYAKSAGGKVYSDASVATPQESSLEIFNYWDEHTESGTTTWKSLGAGESVTLGNYVSSIARPSGNAVTDRANTMILKKTNESYMASYWLASRRLSFKSGFSFYDGYAYFALRCVASDGVDNSASMCASSGIVSTNGNNKAVRPAVYLQSNIELEFNGSTSNPGYTITSGA